MIGTLEELIETALKQLTDLGLSDGTLKSYRTRAFYPIKNLYYTKYGMVMERDYLLGLKSAFQNQYEVGEISKRTLNWRFRGINILIDIIDNDVFEWKVYSQNTKLKLIEPFESTLEGFVGKLSCSNKRKANYESILRRFLNFVIRKGIKDFSEIDQLMVRDFIVEISNARPKSIDDVITALRKFFLYLNQNSYCEETFWMLLSAPRTRDHRVRPCMKQDETNRMLYHIDKTTPKGKRDFAILSLAAATGLRAGDIAALVLTDIDWRKKELHIVQGKTNSILKLPVSKDVLTVIADYILNGRPQTEDNHLFIKSFAPYTGLQDGVSVACIFRKYLSASGIHHVLDDGKTMHGLRRAIGTQMVAEKVPVTTVAQVLGHSGIKATKQYISLEMEGLKKCILEMDSLGGDR